MAASIKRSGKYNFRVRKLDAKECELAFFERAGDKWEEVGVSSFSIAEATQAGLTGNATWKNFPRNMLYARAMSNGAKWYCPDVFGGPIYTPDELGAVVDGETGEVIDLEPEPTKPQPSKPQPKQIAPAAPKPEPTPEQGSDVIDAEIDERPIDAITANQLSVLVDLIDALVEFHTLDAIRQSMQPLIEGELPDLDPANLEAGLTNAEAAKVISKLQKQLEAKRHSGNGAKK